MRSPLAVERSGQADGDSTVTPQQVTDQQYVSSVSPRRSYGPGRARTARKSPVSVQAPTAYGMSTVLPRRTGTGVSLSPATAPLPSVTISTPYPGERRPGARTRSATKNGSASSG